MVEPELAEVRLQELRETLGTQVSNLGLAVMEGNKVLEVKPAGVNKGRAAYSYLNEEPLDFALVAGDDRTDEDLFEVAPETAWTIKVGRGPTRARLSVESHRDILNLLGELAEVD